MAPTRRRLLAAAGLGVAGLAGCGDRPRTGDRPSPGGSTSAPPTADAVGLTHLRPDGNRVLAGAGRIDTAAPVEHALPFAPAWVVGLPDGDGTVWAAVAGDGRTAGVRLVDDGPEAVAVGPARLPAGTPPALVLDDGTPRLLAPPAGTSRRSHPLPVGGGRALAVGEAGDLVLLDGDGVLDRLAVDALPDARVVATGDGRYAVLGGATDRYPHGALGDDVEASAVVVAAVGGERLEARSRVDLPNDRVVEGLLPLVAPLVDGGPPRLVVTETDARAGARQVAYALDGGRLAAGPPVGAGFRWRHRLAAAPFGPDGARELAVVRTPHLGGVVEFYRHRGDGLVVAATASGYSSHAFGSRNLDGGLAADLDGDGAVELLVPTQDRRRLVGLRRTPDGVEAALDLPLDGALATNVAGATTADGGLVVAAGRPDGTLRLWR